MAPVSWILRDKLARLFAAEHEVSRNALRYVTRNDSIPLGLRLRAQLALNSFPRYMRRVAIHRGRCVDTGRIRGFIRQYKLSRIVWRDSALGGLLPGVKKSTW